MAIFSKTQADGRRVFGALGSRVLVGLIEQGIRKGDIIDVFGGTVQVVLNPRVASFVPGRYTATTLTKNDNRELEEISYKMRRGKVIGVSKKTFTKQTRKSKVYEKFYDEVLGM